MLQRTHNCRQRVSLAAQGNMPKDRVGVVLGNVNRAPNAWPRVKDRLRLGRRVILEADLKPRRLQRLPTSACAL